MAPSIHCVTRLDLTFAPCRWVFAEERRAEIDAHFAARQRETPQLWNGRVLLARDPVFAGGCFSARYFEADFASFLAWRDWGCPDATVFNGFGMGALRGSDGVFVLGEMAAHTANAGKIYFPSGTPDRNDLNGTTVDIAGSVLREVAEETGLTEADFRVAPYWDCIVSGGSIALMRLLQLDLPAEALRRRIEANLAKQRSPELSAMHLVRDRNDFTAAIPAFVTAFVEAKLQSAA